MDNKSAAGIFPAADFYETNMQGPSVSIQIGIVVIGLNQQCRKENALVPSLRELARRRREKRECPIIQRHSLRPGLRRATSLKEGGKATPILLLSKADNHNWDLSHWRGSAQTLPPGVVLRAANQNINHCQWQ